MFEPEEINKLQVVTDQILAQTTALTEGLTKKRDNVLESRKEMWKEARIVLRDFDDVADLSIFVEDVARNEREYADASKELIKLKKMLGEPYFARIDFVEDGYGDVEQIYIGRHSLFDEDTKMFHIYDWRAPISSLYYDFGVGDGQFVVPATKATITGKITLKRQYQIEKGQLLYLFDNDIAIDDEILRRELSKSADAHIKTIVNTIQAEQNAAIRADAHTVLVHGPAGSGKTSVGLHRLAYLLYRDRGKLSSARVKIFSPSPVFASYIEGIIPELGEDDVENLDFPALIEEKATAMRKFHGLFDQIQHITSQPESARSQWLRHKYSKDFLDQLEDYVADYKPSFEDVMFETDTLCKAKKLEELYQDRTTTSTLKSKTDRVLSYVERAYSEYYKENLVKITELFNAIHAEDFSDAEVREKYEEEKLIVTRDLRNRLRPRAIKMYEKFLNQYGKSHNLPKSYPRQSLTAEKLCYEDALLLFLVDIITGKVPQDKTVKHILLDEAQDLSQAHHRILKKLYTSSHFTVLADANQALYKDISIESIDHLSQLYPTAQNIALTKSYRSTYEINTFAAQFLQNPNPDASYTRHGEAPQVIKSADQLTATVDVVAQAVEKNARTIGILLPTTNDAIDFYNQIKGKLDGVKLIADENDQFAPGVMVMAVPFAKGLEFDTVICPDYQPPVTDFDNRLMYLICTRALHHLYLIRGE